MVSISTGENPRSSRLTIGARNQFGWMMPVGRGEFLPLSGQSSGHPGGAEADVKARIGKARAAFLQLKNVWSSKDLRLQTKIRIFNRYVKPVLLYGSEMWRTTVATTKKVQTFINHVYEESCGYVGQLPSTTKTYGKEPTRGLQMLRS